MQSYLSVRAATHTANQHKHARTHAWLANHPRRKLLSSDSSSHGDGSLDFTAGPINVNFPQFVTEQITGGTTKLSGAHLANGCFELLRCLLIDGPLDCYPAPALFNENCRAMRGYGHDNQSCGRQRR